MLAIRATVRPDLTSQLFRGTYGNYDRDISRSQPYHWGHEERVSSNIREG